jgi:hypothetical protein
MCTASNKSPLSITNELKNAMNDPTEEIRRQLLAETNSQPGSRESLEVKYGQVWDAQQLADDFEVLAFMAPFVVVRRKADGVKGSLQFQHSPRLYYSFVADR